jgi:hypothetical protein
LGRVDDEHPRLGRRRHVDVVDADARPADDLEPRRRLEELPIDGRGGPHHQARGAGETIEQLLPVHSDGQIDSAMALEGFDPGRGDLLRHHHERPVLPYSRLGALFGVHRFLPRADCPTGAIVARRSTSAKAGPVAAERNGPYRAAGPRR